MRLFHRGREEILHEDTYYMCAQIQRQCRGFSEEQVRSLVKKIVANLADSLNLQETQRMPSREGGEQETEINPPVRGPQRIEMETEIFSRQEIENEAKKRRKKFEE